MAIATCLRRLLALAEDRASIGARFAIVYGRYSMRPLSQRFGIGLLLLGSVFIFVGAPDLLDTRSAQRAWDLGHLLFFLFATLAWLRWDRNGAHWSNLRTWAFTLMVVNLTGLLIEGAQHVLGRDASASDLFLDNVGAVVALAFFARCKDAPTNLKVVLRGMAVALLVWSLVPFFAALSDEFSASRSFPMLSDFETPFQLSRWESDVVLSFENDTVRKGDGALRVPLSTARYSTASLQYFPGDWSGTSLLAASVFNPDREPLELVIRVHDRWHDEHGMRYDDRFNRRFVISTGWNDLEIPVSDIASAPRERSMDLTKIEGLSFFSVELPRPRTIFIDQVELR